MNNLFLKSGLTGIFIVILFFQTAWSADFERRDVTFKSQGLNCAGWYYVPKDLKPAEKRPVIVMAPGYGAVKEMSLDKFAERFAKAGFIVLAFDFRYFGASAGEPRGQLFYYEQHQDYRNAISWVSLQKEVDSQSIGIWGSSYSGGHVLHLAALDRRVKAVVAQVPMTKSFDSYYQERKPEDVAKRFSWLAANRMEEYKSGKVNYFPLIAPEGQRAAMPSKEAYQFLTEATKNVPSWKNQVTMESIDINTEYAPAAYIHRISPTPLLMLVASNDITCPVESQKKAFEQAKEPKKLVVIKGGHFDVYREPALSEFSGAAVAWFRQYLKP
jgi:fermentation-respiration switch protein FrsA (DUF1100 family)